jgi:hypothetical protein
MPIGLRVFEQFSGLAAGPAGAIFSRLEPGTSVEPQIVAGHSF